MTEADTAVITPYRTLFDSVNPDVIPRDAQMVAGYVPPSRYAWTNADFARWPEAAHVRITVTGTPDYDMASVIDVESAAFTAHDAAWFVPRRNAKRKNTATVYVQLSNLPFVSKACAGLDYWVWCAEWPAYPSATEIDTIKAQLKPGAKLAGIQYRNLPVQDYDLSLVIAAEWHKQPA